MGLIDDLRANDKKGLFKSTDAFVNYPTGFLPLDYANGFVLDVYNEKTKKIEKRPIIGLMGGKFTYILGWSGTGKSTLAAQIAANILRPFKDGILNYVDAEHTAIKQRLLDLSGFRQDDDRLILNTENTSIEAVMRIMTELCEKKEAGGNNYKYDIPYFTKNGKAVKAYIPTFIIIDSLYAFCSEKFFDESDVLDKGTGAMREARQVAEFLDKSLPLMDKYNINVLLLNHLKPKGKLDPYASPAPQLIMLKPDETVPKGYAPFYLAQNALRLNAIKSNFYTKESEGFSGMKVTCQIAKTKTTFIGATLDLSFNERFGFDPVYTLYEFASNSGIIQGRNPYLYFVGFDSIKFNRKDFRKRYIDDTEFRAMTNEAIKPLLNSLLGSKLVDEDDKTNENKYVDIAQLSA